MALERSCPRRPSAGVAYDLEVLVTDVARAVGIFVVTNLDDLVVLSLFFGRAAPTPGRWRQVVAGQYLGIAAIVALALVGALGATLLPDGWSAYLGLVPLVLGIREAVRALRADRDGPDAGTVGAAAPSVLFVASVTLANGGDNVAVYVPLLATTGTGAAVVAAVTFVVMTGLWCALAAWIATRPPVARTLERWGDVLLPAVLIALGVTILVQGDAFGW